MFRKHKVVAGLFAFFLLAALGSVAHAKPGNGKGKPGSGGEDPPPPTDTYSLLLSKCCFHEVFVSGEDPSQLTRVWDKSIANHQQAVWLPGGEQFAFNGYYALDGGDRIPGIWSALPDGSIVETLVLETDTFRISGADGSIASAPQRCDDLTPRLYFLAGEFDENVPYGSYINVYSVDPLNPAVPERETVIPAYRKRAVSASSDGELLAVWLEDESGTGVLQVRDLCEVDAETGEQVLWEWTDDDLGLDEGHRLIQMDWSIDGILALATVSNRPECMAYCDATIWLVDPFPPAGSPVSALRVTGPGGVLSGIERGISPAWSPDGSQLMFSSATQKKTRMYLYDLNSGSYETVANFSSLSLDWNPYP